MYVNTRKQIFSTLKLCLNKNKINHTSHSIFEKKNKVNYYNISSVHIRPSTPSKDPTLERSVRVSHASWK